MSGNLVNSNAASIFSPAIRRKSNTYFSKSQTYTTVLERSPIDLIVYETCSKTYGSWYVILATSNRIKSHQLTQLFPLPNPQLCEELENAGNDYAPYLVHFTVFAILCVIPSALVPSVIAFKTPALYYLIVSLCLGAVVLEFLWYRSHNRERKLVGKLMRRRRQAADKTALEGAS